MAVFNPDVPATKDPDFLRLSRSIQQPEADKSTGAILSGVGDVLGESVKTADFITKSTIEDEVHSAVDAERDKYTQTLKVADASVRPQTPGDPLSLVNTPDKVPPSLENLAPSLANLDGARAGNKLSETGYFGRLDTLAKDFRARYPGYRDYVDQQIHKTTGIDPANAQIKSLIGDINSFATKANAERDKLESFVRSNLKIPGMFEKWSAFQAGNATKADIYETAANWEATDSKLHRDALLLANYKGDEELKGMFAKTALTDQNAELARNDLANFTIQTPTGPMAIADYFTKVSSGQLPAPTSEQAQAIATDLEAKKAVLAKGMYDYSHRVIPGTPGQSMASQAGEDHAKSSALNALENHNLFSKMLTDEKYGYAHAAANLSKGRSTEFMKALEEGPGGKQIQALRAFYSVGKDFGDGMLASVLASSMTPADKDSITVAASKIHGQPSLRGPGFINRGIDFVDPAKVFTLDMAMDAARSAEDPGKARSAVLNFPAQLSNPAMPDEVKTNLAASTFTGDTLPKVIRSVPMDSVDKGKEVPGKFAAFNTIVSKENSQEMYRLGQKDPQLWNNYKVKVEETFSNEVAVPALRELAAIQVNPNVGVKWDSQRLEFKLEVNGRIKRSRYDAGDPSGFFSAAEGEQAARTIERLNAGISNIAKVYELDKQDKPAQNSYVLRLLMGLGLNPNTPTLPNKMLNQVIEANRKPETK